MVGSINIVLTHFIKLWQKMHFNGLRHFWKCLLTCPNSAFVKFWGTRLWVPQEGGIHMHFCHEQGKHDPRSKAADEPASDWVMSEAADAKQLIQSSNLSALRPSLGYVAILADCTGWGVIGVTGAITVIQPPRRCVRLAPNVSCCFHSPTSVCV